MTGIDNQPHPAPSRLRMPAAVLDALICPHPPCGAGLTPVSNALACASGHTFDVARQGYVSLLSGQRPTVSGDGAAMVQARHEVLEAGHFVPLARRVAEVAAEFAPESTVVADAGAGTGYYLRHVLDALPDAHGVALDLSKYALRRAARSHPRAGAVASDTWRRIPLRSFSVGVLLDILAPRGPEFHRVLASSGALVVVTPARGHLAQIREPLGMLNIPCKEKQLSKTLEPKFVLLHREEVATVLRLDRAALRTVATMGPSAWHIDPAALERRLTMFAEVSDVTAAWTVSVYRPA